MDKKYFIITIDTEADNQWDNEHECSTKNAKFLPRFQELSEKYGFKPVWLTTYEMANDEFYVSYFKEKQDLGLCEIGMHLHAWNTPTNYELKKVTNERAYLIEYPSFVMKDKINNLDTLLTRRFGMKPVSHRSGRWAMNQDYFKLLSDFGYKIDCSVTPHINWKKSLGETGMPGSDYSNYSEKMYLTPENILEIPVTIRKINKINFNRIVSFKTFIKEIRDLFKGRYQWVRPNSSLILEENIDVINKCNKNLDDYIMFMIHSSELMPNGSPNFPNKESIEKLYELIEEIFKYVSKLGYTGITLRDYYMNTYGVDDNEK